MPRTRRCQYTKRCVHHPWTEDLESESEWDPTWKGSQLRPTKEGAPARHPLLPRPCCPGHLCPGEEKLYPKTPHLAAWETIITTVCRSPCIRPDS